MKKNLTQRYGLLRQIPRKAMISSSSCCDNSDDFGQYSRISSFLSQYDVFESYEKMTEKITTRFLGIYGNTLYICSKITSRT